MTLETLQDLCSAGTCNHSQTIRKGFDFDTKIYTDADKLMLERQGFAETQIFTSSQLDGSRSLGGEQSGSQIVTIVPGMKPGMEKKMKAERFEAPTWQGELDGRLATDCSFHPGSSRRIVEDERFMAVKYVVMEDEICVPEVLETVEQDRLLPGWENNYGDTSGFFNRLVISQFIEGSHINVDRHAWMGDYGSADDRVKHVDGFLKILSTAQKTSQGQAIKYCFTGDLTNVVIAGKVGGMAFDIAFQGDADTTLQSLATFLASKTESAGTKSLFKSVVYGGNRCITITAWEGELVKVNFALANSAGKKLNTCPDGTLESVDPYTGTAVSIGVTEMQEAVTNLSPISLDVREVTANNVIQILDEWYDTVTAIDPEQLDAGFETQLLVARNVYNAYKRAQLAVTRSRSLDGAFGTNLRDMPMDFMGIPVVPMNYMPKNMFIGAAPVDLLVGVDLTEDINTFETWMEPDCKTIGYRGAMTLGFQVARVNKISGTFCDPSNRYFNWQSPMPAGIKRNRRLQPVAIS